MIPTASPTLKSPKVIRSPVAQRELPALAPPPPLPPPPPPPTSELSVGNGEPVVLLVVDADVLAANGARDVASAGGVNSWLISENELAARAEFVAITLTTLLVVTRDEVTIDASMAIDHV
jgi:hypothetical protein